MMNETPNEVPAGYDASIQQTIVVTQLRDEAAECLTNEEYYHFVKWLRKCYDRLSPDNDYDLDVG